jgi:hypothetical protein
MEAEIQLNREKALAQIDLRRAELAEEAQLEAIKMSANLPGGQGNINMNN